MPKRNKAFTLLELIVVIVILGVLAAIAVPTFAAVIDRSKNAATETTLEAIARDARALYAFGDTTWVAALETAAGETARATAAGTQASSGWTVRAANGTAPAQYELVYTVTPNGLDVATTSGAGAACAITVSTSPSDATCGSSTSAQAPAAALSAPQNVTATPGNNKLTVQWAAVADATSYTISAAPANSGTAVTADVTTNSGTVAGLTNGTSYLVTVTAKDAGGRTATSEPITATPADPTVTFTAADAKTYGFFGQSVAVDGDVAVVGAGSDAGAAYVYTRTNGTWTYSTKLTRTATANVPVSSSDSFGYSVAVDGNTIAVGAWGNSSRGAVYIYTGSGATWTQQTALLGTASDARLGWSVALEGNLLVAGAPEESYNGYIRPGAAYVYTGSGANWTAAGRLTGEQARDYENFGTSVSVSGNTVAVGSKGDKTVNQYSPAGAAYVFDRNGSSWDRTKVLGTLDGSPTWNTNFGQSVDIEGNTLVVGALTARVNSIQSGAAFVFTRPSVGAAWTQSTLLAPGNGGADDYFGNTVSISGNSIVVGSPLHDSAGSNAGAVYTSTRTNGTWSATTTLMSGASAGSQLGTWVSLDGTSAFFGARCTTVGTTECAGSAVATVLP